MSESIDGAGEEGTSPTNVTELPDAGKRNEHEPAAEPTKTSSAGRVWMIASFALLALLVVSGGLNLYQWSERGASENEAAQLADTLAAEADRADVAEQAASSLRSEMGDVLANMTSIQESLAQIVATTGGILDSSETLAAADEEPSTLDVVVEAAGEAIGAVGEVASEGAAAVLEVASSVVGDQSDASESESALPDVAAPTATKEEEGGISSALSGAWTSTRDGISGLASRVKGDE